MHDGLFSVRVMSWGFVLMSLILDQFWHMLLLLFVFALLGGLRSADPYDSKTARSL